MDAVALSNLEIWDWTALEPHPLDGGQIRTDPFIWSFVSSNVICLNVMHFKLSYMQI